MRFTEEEKLTLVEHYKSGATASSICAEAGTPTLGNADTYGKAVGPLLMGQTIWNGTYKGK